MTLHLIALLTVLLHLAFAGARITLSLFALKLGASPLTVGLVMSLLAIVPMLFAVSWGRYVDRVGVRGPMLAGSAAVLAAMLLAFSTANVIGPTIAGFAIDWIGHRYTFLLLGSTALTALVVLAAKTIKTPQHKPHTSPGKRGVLPICCEYPPCVGCSW